jgi:uncharacterized membrane protein
MNIYVLLFLRIFHIVAGVLWVGAAVLYTTHIKPAVRLAGPAGSVFMEAFVQRRKLPVFMQVNSLLTVVAGVVLYWYSSGGLSASWITSGPGLGYTIGSIAGLLSFLMGSLLIGPRAGRIGKLGQTIAAAGGPPTAAQAEEMQRMESELARIEQIEFVLLLIALVTMATARYWYF